MKNLKDSISEKLSIDSISEKLSKDSILEKLRVDDIRFDEFPINGTLDNIIEFLKEQGFKFIEKVDSMCALFNKAKSKCFTYIGNNKRIWFADTSERRICKENPIFYINPEINYRVYYVGIQDYLMVIVDDDKKAFLKELNKRFGWQ